MHHHLHSFPDALLGGPGAFTDFAAWSNQTSLHSVRVAGGDLSMGRWYVAVRTDAHWNNANTPDLLFSLTARESLKASQAVRHVCAETHANKSYMGAGSSLTLSCGGASTDVITALTLSDWSSGPVFQGVGVLASTCKDSSNAKLPICHGPCAADLPARCMGKHSCTIHDLIASCGPVNLGALAAKESASQAEQFLHNISDKPAAVQLCCKQAGFQARYYSKCRYPHVQVASSLCPPAATRSPTTRLTLAPGWKPRSSATKPNTICDLQSHSGLFSTNFSLVLRATCSAWTQVCVDSGPVAKQTCRGHGRCALVNGLLSCSCTPSPDGQTWAGSDW